MIAVTSLLIMRGASAEEHASEDDWRGTSTPCTDAPPNSADVTDWLRTMYEDIFEAVFGSWLGNYSCPFVSV